MPPAFVQSATFLSANGSGTTGAVAFPSGLTAGNVLVVAAYTSNLVANSTVAVTDSLGQTFTRAGPYVSGVYGPGGHADLSVWYVVGTRGGSDTVTVTASRANFITFSVHEYSIPGAPQGLVDGYATFFGNTGSPVAVGPAAVSAPNDLMFAVWGIDTATTAESVAAPYAVREDHELVANQNLGIVTADHVASAAESASLSFTAAGNIDCSAVLVGFRSYVPAARPPEFYLPVPGAPWARRLVPPPRYYPTFPPPPPIPPPVYGRPAAFVAPGAPTFPFLPTALPPALRTPVPPPPPPPPPPLPGATGSGRPYLERTTTAPDPDRARRISDKVSILVNALFAAGHVQQTGMSKTGPQFKIITGAFERARNPTAADDATIGAHPGSPWVNTATGQGFMCISAARNAAVWKQVTT